MKKRELFDEAKPITFRSNMLTALSKGRKSTFRELVKLADASVSDDNLLAIRKEGDCYNAIVKEQEDCPARVLPVRAKYKEGDILYVRETWAAECVYENAGTYGFDCIYKADDAHKIRPIVTTDFDRYEKWMDLFAKKGWKSPVSMPKEAARFLLRITDVRVERLQDITEEGAYLEGTVAKPVMCFSRTCDTCKHRYNYPNADRVNTGDCQGALYAFAETVWNTALKEKDKDRNWDANPWVFVYEFERIGI